VHKLLQMTEIKVKELHSHKVLHYTHASAICRMSMCRDAATHRFLILLQHMKNVLQMNNVLDLNSPTTWHN
jgi:hypothetical protein